MNPITLSDSSTATSPSCRNCPVRSRCLPGGVDDIVLERLDRLMVRRLAVKRHHALCRRGDPCAQLLAIRQGQFKREQAVPGGMRVLGFYMPGQVMGFDGIGSDAYNCNTVALTDSVVCAIPYPAVIPLLGQDAQLQRNFHRMMGDEIVCQQAATVLLGNLKAAPRLAGFLLEQAAGHAQGGRAPARFVLCMSRCDIASYLGLTVESISRLFAIFRQARVLQVRNRSIELLDLDLLGRIASGKEPDRAVG